LDLYIWNNLLQNSSFILFSSLKTYSTSLLELSQDFEFQLQVDFWDYSLVF
jgi:hypothetical protein